MRTRPRAALIALTAGLLLAGCSVPVGTAAPSPTPTDTVTPAPDPTSTQPPDYDARCDAVFGIPVAVPEEKHRIRPTGWPQTPPFASLCLLEPLSVHEERGSYATDPGTKFDDVLWYYEHAFTAGHHGYVPVPGPDKVFSGVLDDVSYYLEQDGFDRYVIHWAWDGHYDYEE